MKVLIVGGGGREHALGWKLAQSPLLTSLSFAPGNPGTAAMGANLPLKDGDAIVQHAKEQEIDLVVVGPEQPLVDGLADALEAVGIPCFGPKAEAARLEGSKAFAKKVMDATAVPTAAFETFTDYHAALEHVRNRAFPLVVKADGLAAGKGVVICNQLSQAEEALQDCMQKGTFGPAGNKVVIEDFLEGTEASFHLISDGQRFLPLITAKDHKAIGEGDTGPNTGGMGTFAPNPLITPELADRIQKEICEPVLRHLAASGTPFRGVLFAGLMLTWNGPKVLEFNVRFGDPETQVMMPMLDFDLLPVLHGAACGNLPYGDHDFKPGASVCVVLAAEGYPGTAKKGDVIQGINEHDPNGQVFHAGTALSGDHLLTGGGRVLGATAWGADLAKARSRAYRLANAIQFDGVQFRRDIGVVHD